MSDTTPNLAMPYILPSQALKHVTHNEALQIIDGLAQLAVLATLTAPPSDPEDGACFAIDDAATGLWAGRSGKLALRQDGDWIYLSPRAGWRGWFLAEDRLKVHDGVGWEVFDPIGTPPRFGINTTADDTNRLAVAGPASLFTHSGNGHRMALNKAAAAETASLLFQTGFSGRAEIGLAGSDQLTVKTSANGSTWTTALTLTAGGTVLTPQRPLARATLGGGVQTPANNSLTGFQTLSLSQGDVTLGAAVPGGTGNRLVVPVTGPYLVALAVDANPNGAFSVTVEVNGTTALARIADNDAATAAYQRSAAGIAMLTAGDWLALRHTGSTPIDFGLNKTELMLVML
ncbi:Protein of unknown function [Rhizobium sp. RU20A]|uniref:DUF2793 domain-containing protein n=1 Tax=Rhizobium sp. RU20A TaxID=1907412 RepID=UPI00095683D7|nr:DUF2793 domain-containing protein [Rhizobium sp. RU20A]SIQ33414.1 Protein of unknown function [Rhizobium sp. RU20A]